MSRFKDFLKCTEKAFSNALFPKYVTCDICQQDLFDERTLAVCDDCYKILPFVSLPCAKCGKGTKDGKCKLCQSVQHHFKQAVSVFEFVDPITTLIHRFKYGHEFHLKSTFVHFMLLKYNATNWNIDCVVCSPMSKKKEIVRIKNQARELANEFCARSNLPNVSDILVKNITQTQTELNREQRFANVKDSIKITDSKRIKGKNVLVIDDVMTTSATVNAISKVLKEHGAKNVYVLTVATVSIID